MPRRGPALPVEASCEVLGGEPFMWVDRVPVAARALHKQGSVMAIGFGPVLNDTAMGGHWMLTPDDDQLLRSDLDPGLLTRYDLLFALLEGLIEKRPVVGPAGALPRNEGLKADETGGRRLQADEPPP